MKLRAPDAADSPGPCPACPRRHFPKLLASSPDDSVGPLLSFQLRSRRQRWTVTVVRTTAPATLLSSAARAEPGRRGTMPMDNAKTLTTAPGQGNPPPSTRPSPPSYRNEEMNVSEWIREVLIYLDGT